MLWSAFFFGVIFIFNMRYHIIRLLFKRLIRGNKQIFVFILNRFNIETIYVYR